MPPTIDMCVRTGCDKPAEVSLALKAWPAGVPRAEHNFLVIEIGMCLCKDHVAEVITQGRDFFVFKEENRAMIDSMIQSSGKPPPDWDTAEIYVVPLDGSVIIDPNSTSTVLPDETHQ